MSECFDNGTDKEDRTEVCEFLLAGLGFLFIDNLIMLYLLC